MKRCQRCAQPFAPRKSYHYLCYPCWQARAEDELLDLRREVDRLRQALEDPPAPDPDVLRWLLQRAHPDHNGGSDLAHRATRWLLGLREREAA